MKIALVVTMTTKDFPTFSYYSDAVNKFESLLTTGLLSFKSDLIETLDVSFICVSPEFRRFFKPVRPKYYADKTVKSSDPVVQEVRLYKYLSFDFFMDFETYLNAKDEKECLRVLAISFLKVLEELKYPGKVKKFEREKFNQAVKEFFIKENIISEADIDCKQSE